MRDGPLQTFAVVDLFSGAGGMSYGFHRHPRFKIVGAADAEIGKPSMGDGSLQCNATYAANMGISPRPINLARVDPAGLREALGLDPETHVSVLTVCPPCTGFSRTNPLNHLRDDPRNSLVRKAAEFAVELESDVVVMENARELIRGNFKAHYDAFRAHLEASGFNVFGRNYLLSRFGLPQVRERAIIIAARERLPLYTLESLWDGWTISDSALTVATAFGAIDERAAGRADYPTFADPVVARRLAAIPADGGSWIDLMKRADAQVLMTEAMKRIARLKKFGSYPDVYGRMAWHRPAPTIKRECAHIGNGRYAHPAEDRLCSVREMAMLQGFPNEFVFDGSSLSNNYRHIGDAVPPLISFQLAHLAAWMLTGRQPALAEAILPGTQLRPEHVVRVRQNEFLYA